MTFADHFLLADGALSPQPWMQLRQVATGSTESVSKSYDPTDGSAKNDVLQTLQVAWTNNSPVDQWIYGLMTKSGSQVTLQCRSRGYVSTRHAMDVTTGTPFLELTEVSRFGVGADLGKGGILNVGGAYAISELRQNSVTMPLRPHLTHWTVVPVGSTVTAKIETAFVSENWEGSMIDGGDGDTESKVISGDLRLDLFAIPAFFVPPFRLTPAIVGSSTATALTADVVVSRPAGVAEGDMLVAICGNQFGAPKDITAPTGWVLQHSAREGFGTNGGSHLKVFTKVATASEPATYAFGNGWLAEEIVVVIAVRDATVPEYTDANTSGWSVASTSKKWKRHGDMHVSPSIGREGQLLICASFFGRADDFFDWTLGPVPGHQTAPAGMVMLHDESGTSASLAVASMTNPPAPTGDRTFASVPRALFNNYAISASLLIDGVVPYDESV